MEELICSPIYYRNKADRLDSEKAMLPMLGKKVISGCKELRKDRNELSVEMWQLFVRKEIIKIRRMRWLMIELATGTRLVVDSHASFRAPFGVWPLVLILWFRHWDSSWGGVVGSECVAFVSNYSVESVILSFCQVFCSFQFVLHLPRNFKVVSPRYQFWSSI